MLKKILSLIKKVIFSCFLLYGYNLVATSLDLMIPINAINVGILTIFGIPSLFCLILIRVLIF